MATSCRLSAPRTAAVQTSLWSCSTGAVFKKPAEDQRCPDHLGGRVVGIWATTHSLTTLLGKKKKKRFPNPTSPGQQTWVNYDINSATNVDWNICSLSRVHYILWDRYGLTSSQQKKTLRVWVWWEWCNPPMWSIVGIKNNNNDNNDDARFFPHQSVCSNYNPAWAELLKARLQGLWHVQYELRVQTAPRLLAIAFQLDLLHQRAKRLFSFAFVPPVAFHRICPIPAVDLTLCWGGGWGGGQAPAENCQAWSYEQTSRYDAVRLWDMSIKFCEPNSEDHKHPTKLQISGVPSPRTKKWQSDAGVPCSSQGAHIFNMKSILLHKDSRKIWARHCAYQISTLTAGAIAQNSKQSGAGCYEA